MHKSRLTRFGTIEYRIASQVPLTQSDEVLVNFVKVWERDKTGKQIYHNARVTDFEVTAQNVATIVGIGRSRWGDWQYQQARRLQIRRRIHRFDFVERPGFLASIGLGL